MKELLRKYYRYPAAVTYYLMYLVAFYLLERRVPATLHIIHCSIDQYIPFLEIFIVPYFFWFAFTAITVLVLFVFDREIMFRMIWIGVIGFSLFLFVSYVYPNGLDLRPETFARDNVFVDMVKFLYRIDTPTNVLPSLHVFVSTVAAAAVYRSEVLNKHVIYRRATVVTAVLIILSTMFLKQHSIVDVSMGLLMAYVCNEIVYEDGIIRGLLRDTEYVLEEAGRVRQMKKKGFLGGRQFDRKES
ncbi:MAG: phosphatase PAP2 family protein [Eubacterium sp.]|nr:phosphatase PAP2 family protein [Eubacterium sp.]